MEKQLTAAMTANEIVAMYFDEKTMLAQPERVYRVDAGDGRMYYKFDKDNNPVFYTSVTTMLKNTMPTSPHLIKWIAGHETYEDAQAETAERAAYGTFMHACIAELCINQRYDLDTLEDALLAYINREQLPAKCITWAHELRKDVLAFAQFMIDCMVQPMAVELVLTHPTDGYAGAVDLVCQMDYERKGFFGEVYKTGANAGQQKETKIVERIVAVIDFKSGRKGFYEAHEVQLACYQNMVAHTFPKLPPTRVFNWSPKDWRTAPGYNLKDQTDAPSRDLLPHLVQLQKVKAKGGDTTITVMGGQIDIAKGIATNYQRVTFTELATNASVTPINEIAE